MNIETSTINKGNSTYKVTQIDDMYIEVPISQVEEIISKVTDVDENEVAVLLATIKMSRIIESTIKGTRYKVIDDTLGIRAIIKLLGYYPIDNLISIFEELKYYQIKEVLESDSPVKELEEYI